MVDLRTYAGIMELHPDDQVAVVRAGTSIAELQLELKRHGLCVPLPDPDTVGDAPAGLPGTVGGGLAMNLPHALEGLCGNWRDWVLGLTVIRADGAVARCGSRAVKNVAGYDAARLFVGSRGTLGVVTEAILRVHPLRALPQPRLEGRADWGPRASGWRAAVRLPAEEEPGFLERFAAHIQARDPLTRTVWMAADTAPEGVEWGSRLVWLSDRGPRLTQLEQRAKQVLDPGGKFPALHWSRNPEETGAAEGL